MKVKIGPYINYYGVFQLTDLFLKPFIKDEDKLFEIGKTIDEKFPFINNFCQWIYDKRKRTVKVKIDNYDVWSMDHTLSLIILPMLKKLKDQKHGTPIVNLEDVPEHLRPSEAEQAHMDETGETDDKFQARWDYILDEMIWTFTQLTTDNHDDQFYDMSEWDDSNDMSDNFSKIKVDEAGRDAHNKRIPNGTRLFGVYYQGLWD